jgi:hypothetical protein
MILNDAPMYRYNDGVVESAYALCDKYHVTKRGYAG